VRERRKNTWFCLLSLTLKNFLLLELNIFPSLSRTSGQVSHDLLGLSLLCLWQHLLPIIDLCQAVDEAISSVFLFSQAIFFFLEHPLLSRAVSFSLIDIVIHSYSICSKRVRHQTGILLNVVWACFSIFFLSKFLQNVHLSECNR